MKGKKILIGITGSIAAYKTVLIVRNLIKQGAEVKIIMTAAAKDFVTPLTLSTLSKNPVLADFSIDHSWSNHVMLGRWADIFVIAPLSCNTLAKMANGLCDNLLTAVYLSATCPVVVAPAMDEDMWHHPSTKINMDKIISYGNHVIEVGSGELASGLTGEGRMAEPEEIIQWLQDFFLSSKKMKGKKVLVTAGPTNELLDPVRFIGNYSSGKMGVAIAKEFVNNGAEVTLVLGPCSIEVPSTINVVSVVSAEQMFDACKKHFSEMDIAVMAAAVADYTPVTTESEKIKKSSNTFSLQLKKTKDILGYLGSVKRNDQLLVGFALETTNEKENALGKLQSKNADLIVLNSLKDEGAGFGYNTNKISIFEKGGKEFHFEKKSKTDVAKDIVNTIIDLQSK